MRDARKPCSPFSFRAISDRSVASGSILRSFSSWKATLLRGNVTALPRNMRRMIHRSREMDRITGLSRASTKCNFKRHLWYLDLLKYISDELNLTTNIFFQIKY